LTEQQIRDFLRSRSAVDTPTDLVSSVMGTVDTLPQQRRSWFAALVPGTAVAAVAAVAFALALLLGPSPDVGPTPSTSATAAPTPDQSVVSRPSPVPSDGPGPSAEPIARGSLLEVGDAETLAAVWDGEPIGTIRLERGPETGGYSLTTAPSGETHFFIELPVTYEIDTAPDDASWGFLDWRVETDRGVSVGATDVQSIPPEECGGFGQWPGATVIEPTYTGCLLFAIPRDAADEELTLVYQPETAAEPIARFALRAPGEPPAPVAAEWPRPDPVYVEKPGLPFTVYESQAADALFANTDTCTNPEGGYTVSFPDAWYTNTAIGEVPACSWFSPVFFEATAGGPRPPEIAAEIRVFEGAVGFIWVDLYAEEVLLDGVPAGRSENGMTKDPNTPTDTFQYSYLARLDDEPNGLGRKLWAFTGTEYGGDYELNRGVLDRIMASLIFDD
jgi:hypothetical protein